MIEDTATSGLEDSAGVSAYRDTYWMFALLLGGVVLWDTWTVARLAGATRRWTT